MFENQREIENAAHEYDAASKNIPTPSPYAPSFPTDRLKGLYSSFSKNAKKMLRYGDKTYKPLEYDGEGFTNAPHLNETMFGKKKNLYRLYALSTIDTGSKKNGYSNNPCIISLGEGESDHQFFEHKKPNEGTEAIESPGIEARMPNEEASNEGLNVCSGTSCSECSDCKPHLDAIHDSFVTMLDPSTSGDVRTLHLKNIVSALNNLAAHHDDKAGGSNQLYDNCAHRHSHMATGLRNIATDMTEALQKDGVPHRDYTSGYGKESDTY
jgi:hypothetical protein